MTKIKHKYSEIFTSIQGEGHYTGVPTIWLRWFLCNLQCRGFGQTDPADPKTWDLPYEKFDVSKVTKIEELPVWSKGCDSSYSWAKKYRHLCPEGTAEEIADALEAELRKNEYNPNGLFDYAAPRSYDNQTYYNLSQYHFCMTGGEPMLKKTQLAQVELLTELEKRKNLPRHITIETNGTQEVEENLQALISSYAYTGGEWFWSVSPKLLHTSGEKSSRAIKPSVVKSYAAISKHGQLKFVVRNSKKAWDELERTVDLFRCSGIFWPIWIMPVGATIESQSDDDTRAVVEETIRRGYNVSARVQAYIWGNTIGT